jgi:SAM-dependent methyltransferase
VAAPFRGAHFDLVTSFDVLHALEDADEHAAVQEMYRLLKPGGFALVNVAAMKSLTGDHSVLGQERRRYSRESLTRLIEACGFEVVRVTYTNATLFLPLAIIRAFQRWRGLPSEPKGSPDITVPPAPVNALLTALLRLENLWVRRFNTPFGSSLLCLARKPDRAGT